MNYVNYSQCYACIIDRSLFKHKWHHYISFLFQWLIWWQSHTTHLETRYISAPCKVNYRTWQETVHDVRKELLDRPHVYAIKDVLKKVNSCVFIIGCHVQNNIDFIGCNKKINMPYFFKKSFKSKGVYKKSCKRYNWNMT